jgi:hypothetical protein
MKMAMLGIFLIVSMSLVFAGDTNPPKVAPAAAKDHIGEMAMVCGKVVDSKVFKNGLSGFGTPIQFDLDQPEPNPVFYFIAAGPEVAAVQTAETQKSIDAYNGKQVCVTGKIASAPAGGAPFILAAKRTQIKIQSEK